MLVIQDPSNLPKYPACVLCMGTFDGLHLGHRQILEVAKKESLEHTIPLVVLTYWPHPRKILQPGVEIELLSDRVEKNNILRQLGVDVELEMEFGLTLSRMPAKKFLEDIILSKIRPSILVTGFDHTFGYQREGTVEYLKQHLDAHQVSLIEIPKQSIEQNKISSTSIRLHLKNGRLREASILLGRNYSLSGTVIQGDQIGRTLGFPTANIRLRDTDKLIPKHGVYAAMVRVNDQEKLGVVNIGIRPTLDGKELRIEAHIMDFWADLYTQSLELELLDYIRSEKKFENLSALSAQLVQDVAYARQLHPDKAGSV